MKTINHTGFPVLAFQGVTPADEPFHIVVLRQTFSFAQGPLTRAAEQSPLCETDVFAGEPNQSRVLAESDLCHFKPRCDVIVNGTAYAPGAGPAKTFQATLQVWKPGAERFLVNKTLVVSGPSAFRKRHVLFRIPWFLLKVGTLFLLRRSPWKQTRPEKLLQLPLCYEHAFGGQARVFAHERAAARVRRKNWLPGVDGKALKAAPAASDPPIPLAWTLCEANPIGKGFGPSWFLKAAKVRTVPAPQISAPGSPFTSRQFCRALAGKADATGDPAFLPQGFGILPKAWGDRPSLVGTVDDAWIMSCLPLPEDFRFAIWNGAPPDQQVPYLEGDELIELTNLCPLGVPGSYIDIQGQTKLRLQLPGDMPYVLVRFKAGLIMPVRLNLDTLSLNPDEGSLVLVWRAVLPMEPRIRTLETRLVPREEKAAWLARGGPEFASRPKPLAGQAERAIPEVTHG